ncbi:retrovirus-related Pol polyprotein from transposon 412 [Penaeus vannamei]|uniref:retrovirus-related Pol polyprotein from transposon 412 n=1 Tax=Penaeus vannamei TaxID=6689 RepID=UPI00387F55FA
MGILLRHSGTHNFWLKCMENGVTLRPDKLHFCKRSVTFAGELLKKPVAKLVDWDEQLQAIFSSVKDTIEDLAAVRLRYYDVSRPTAVFTDYSCQGAGFYYATVLPILPESLLCYTGGWKVVLCGSRHLTAAEKNCSTLEGEALTVAWCLKKARLFLLGYRNLTFITDHKALTRIFGVKELKDLNNPRILNLHSVSNTEGWQDGFAADALSRYPMLFGHPEESDEADDELVCAAMVAATSEAVEGDGGRVVDVKQVKEEAAKDEEYQLLQECVSNECWTDCENMEPLALQPYFRMRRHLSCQGNIVLYTNDVRQPCLVIPMALRHAVLTNLHAEHQGRDNALQSMLYLFQVTTDLFQLNGQIYIAYADR